ncbi:MAG: YegP family protein [Paludibacteraceae bacterium]|nr:YegP family protein [Paludibacteraceae bacterium]
MGKFVIEKSSNDKFKFNLKAGNNEIIATSQMYASLATCKNGIESVRKNSIAAAVEDQTVEGFETQKNPKWEIYKDAKGEFRFRLKATNGEIIATGEGYKAKAGCLNGIESIKKNAPDAELVENL